jgi:hypothetical protein
VRCCVLEFTGVLSTKPLGLLRLGCVTMLQDTTTPDAFLFSALFSACATGRTPDLLDLAAKAEADMHTRWSSQKTMRSSKQEPKQ